MIRLTRKTDHPLDTDTTLTLTYDQRVRSRLRVVLDDGREAGLFLERGGSLRDGDHLLSDEGLAVRVRAGDETLSSVRCDDPLLFARACYHLGNRHVALQIGPGILRYPHDHVLDDMLRGLGLTVGLEQAPFEPEAGAYEGGHQAHGHRHHDH
ncbi:urease accessory protein UreE [Thiorhodococcus fuscus]|uniref:Urease accessory protein UreE n=1 Tax=Thiorhodococcus fuscus TaxID=527200 RepID=A0ABW4YC94_9GAMM